MKIISENGNRRSNGKFPRAFPVIETTYVGALCSYLFYEKTGWLQNFTGLSLFWDRPFLLYEEVMILYQEISAPAYEINRKG